MRTTKIIKKKPADECENLKDKFEQDSNDIKNEQQIKINTNITKDKVYSKLIV